MTYYYTQLIGNPKKPPTILAAESFTDFSVIGMVASLLEVQPTDDLPLRGQSELDVHQPSQLVRFGLTAVRPNTETHSSSFRSVRNLVIDTRRIPPEVPAIAMHWQVSQATSLMNIVIHMSDAANTEHQGIWMENGRWAETGMIKASVGSQPAVP